MGVGRLAPYRIRARYAQALKEIPLPVRSFGGIDPAALTTVGEADIAGRRVQFGKLYAIPRLWITLPDQIPPVLGFLTGFDCTATDHVENGPTAAVRTTANPELHITALDHLDWARHPNRAAALKREACTAWLATQKEYEG